MVTSLVTAKALANDRYRRHRDHFDLDPEETIEKYVGILPYTRIGTGTGTLHDDDVDKIVMAGRVVDDPFILKNQSLGKSTSPLNDLVWKVTIATTLILATILCFHRNHDSVNTVMFIRERINKIRIIFYQNMVTTFSRFLNQRTLAVKGSKVTSESQQMPSSTNGQTISIDHESSDKDHKRNRNYRNLGHKSMTNKKSKRRFPASPAEPFIVDDVKGDNLMTTSINKSLPMDSTASPPLYNEHSNNTTINQLKEATDIKNLDHVSVEGQLSEETATTLMPIISESSFLQVKVAEAFSQIDDSFVEMVLADATKDAVRVAASMATFSKLGLSPNVGVQFAMHRSSSELEEQHARDREHRHWERTSFLYQHSEREANRRAEATNAAIRESSPWLVDIYAARDECLATISNAFIMGLAIAAILFLSEVEYLTMEALDWQTWTWQNLKACMGCDEEVLGNNTIWQTVYSGTLSLSSAANLVPSAAACVVRRLMFAGFAGIALVVLTWVLEAFRTPVLVRQAVGALFLWFNIGTSTLVMKTIYQRVIPQFVIATLVSGYIYNRCDAVIHLTKESMERERLVTAFRVGIDQLQRRIRYAQLLLVTFVIVLEVTWHLPYSGMWNS